MILQGPSLVGDLVLNLGLENYAVKLYDDREMIAQVMDARVDLAIRILDKAVREVAFDFLFIWEDMAFRNGPMVGPAIFEELIVPRYRRLTDWYRSPRRRDRGPGLRRRRTEADPRLDRGRHHTPVAAGGVRGHGRCGSAAQVRAGASPCGAASTSSSWPRARKRSTANWIASGRSFRMAATSRTWTTCCRTRRSRTTAITWTARSRCSASGSGQVVAPRP